MSYNSVKQLPRNSNCSGVSQSRSISDVIRSLKSSFLDTDFSNAVRELEAREEGLRRQKEEVVASLREKNGILETQLGELKMEKYEWEDECRILRRDAAVNDLKLNDLTRELSLMKEKEEKAIKRYDRLLEEFRTTQKEKEKDDLMKEKNNLMRNLADLTDVMEGLKSKLRQKEGVVDELARKNDAEVSVQKEKLERVRSRIACLEQEKLNFEASLEELKREKDEEIKELLKRNEAEKSQVEAQCKACVEELRKSNGEKDLRIKKLMEEINNLERERKKIVKAREDKIQELEQEKEVLGVEKSDLTAKLGQVEERLLKLEEDVVTCMCLDLSRDKRFASSHIGKILSGIIKVLDSEEIGLTCNAGVVKVENLHEADSVVASQVNEPKCYLKSEKQSIEAVRKTLNFEAEFSKDVATGIKKTAIDNLTIIISDDEDESSLHVNGVTNKRKCPGSINERNNHDSDDSLDPKCKIKKVEPVLREQVKQEPLLDGLSAHKSDHKFNAKQMQTLATLKKCDENLRREVSGSRSSFLEDDGRKGDGSKSNYGTPNAVKTLDPEVGKYMTSLRQRREDKKLDCVADMVLAFDKDADFCAKAVCALYRRSIFDECDFERVTALAGFLTDGDPSGKMKRSVDELRQHDTRGLVDCRRLAIRYSKKLMDVYRKKDDPLFSPLSTDLQYN